MRKYIWEYLKSFGWGYLTLLLSIISAINAYFNITGNPISIFTIVPTWGWLTLLILGLLVTPFFSFYKVKTKLGSYENAKPNVILDQTRGALLYIDHTNINGMVVRKEACYYIVQAWFVNLPIQRSSQAIADSITATIEFYDKNATNLRFNVYGQWALSTAPNHVGQKGFINKVNMLPNNERHKLNIALKWPDDDECYSYSQEGLIAHPDGRNPGNKLPCGEYTVCVKLEGIGVDQSFWFILINPGKSGNLELREIS